MSENKWQSRTKLLIKEQGIANLRKAHVLIVGLGGVGSYVAEMLARAGVGHLTIIDGDKIDVTNINRQLPALHSTVGKRKATVMAERLIDINPQITLNVIDEYIQDERLIEILKMHPYDYVVDAIDTITPKIFLLVHCLQNELKVISSMGAGGKFDPLKIQITDISKSYHCRLAKLIRKRLHVLGIRKGIKVVFSPEPVSNESLLLVDEPNKKSTVGTISYMTAIFGCICSSVVLRELSEAESI